MSAVYAEDPFDQPLAEPLLTATDAANLLAVRPGWVYAAVRQGNLPDVRVGREVRFLRTDLEAFVVDHRANGGAAR